MYQPSSAPKVQMKGRRKARQSVDPYWQQRIDQIRRGNTPRKFDPQERAAGAEVEARMDDLMEARQAHEAGLKH